MWKKFIWEKNHQLYDFLFLRQNPFSNGGKFSSNPHKKAVVNYCEKCVKSRFCIHKTSIFVSHSCMWSEWVMQASQVIQFPTALSNRVSTEFTTVFTGEAYIILSYWWVIVINPYSNKINTNWLTWDYRYWDGLWKRISIWIQDNIFNKVIKYTTSPIYD